MRTVLVCGGRDFQPTDNHARMLREFLVSNGCTKLVHGDARGADRWAGEVGKQMGLEVVAVPADWDAHGRSAGPIRNQRMLDEHEPSLVIAFSGGNGTADMVERARKTSAAIIQLA